MAMKSSFKDGLFLTSAYILLIILRNISSCCSHRLRLCNNLNFLDTILSNIINLNVFLDASAHMAWSAIRLVILFHRMRIRLYTFESSCWYIFREHLIYLCRAPAFDFRVVEICDNEKGPHGSSEDEIRFCAKISPVLASQTDFMEAIHSRSTHSSASVI
jgi:hypothetical protein